MCVDYYLYNFFFYPAQIITKSSQSYKLLHQILFTGNLDKLHEISKEIIINYLKVNKINQDIPSGKDDTNALKDIIKILKKDDLNKMDDNYIIIDGKKCYCNLEVNY